MRGCLPVRLTPFCAPLLPQGLELLHTLFVKEHNAIAAKLASTYPTLTDQQLFDKARMVTAAVMAKIHTVEWTPAILPNKGIAAAMRSNWAGAISLLSQEEALVVQALFGKPNEAIFGYRGGPRIDAGVKYSMTEVGHSYQ